MKTLQQIWDGLRLSSQKFAHYIPLYERYFAPLRETTGNILEIGVLGGGSLEMWREYFHNATIWGLDIDPDAARIPHVNPWMSRVEIMCGSIYDDSVLRSLASRKWTIIIDDGPHFTWQQIRTAKSLLPELATPGVYWVEDLFPEHRRQFSTAYPLGRHGIYGYLRRKFGLGYTDWANRLEIRSDLKGIVTGVHTHDGVVVIEKYPHQPFYPSYKGTCDGRYESVDICRGNAPGVTDAGAVGGDRKGEVI